MTRRPDSELRTAAELTQPEKRTIQDRLGELVATLSSTLSVCQEAVANEIFYKVQRHAVWGRNAKPAQKKASFEYWKRKCHRCSREVALEDAKFHHLRRGVPGQHGPENLVPEHQDCHDAEHGITQSSLSKGAPKRRRQVP